MPDQDLAAALGELVRRHGLSSVLHGLAEVKVLPDMAASPAPVRGSPRKKVSRPSAVDYVGKMTLPSDKAEVLMRAAERFERKTFLPSIGHIREFCRVHRVPLSKTVSRANSVPRIFTYLAAMDTARITATLDRGAFAGPARLGPIADAIREHSGRKAMEDDSRMRDL